MGWRHGWPQRQQRYEANMKENNFQTRSKAIFVSAPVKLVRFFLVSRKAANLPKRLTDNNFDI